MTSWTWVIFHSCIQLACNYYFRLMSQLKIKTFIVMRDAECFLGGYLLKQLGAAEAIICLIASQIANVGESIIGAALQEKEGFQWVGSHSNYYLVSLYSQLFCKPFQSYSLYILISVWWRCSIC